jgi:hypothetical protein
VQIQKSTRSFTNQVSKQRLLCRSEEGKHVHFVMINVICQASAGQVFQLALNIRCSEIVRLLTQQPRLHTANILNKVAAC